MEVRGRLNFAPPTVHTLISETDDCYLIWQKGLYRCDQVNELRNGKIILHDLGAPKVIPVIFIKRTQESVRGSGQVTKEAHAGVRSFDDRGSVHKPMNRGIH